MKYTALAKDLINILHSSDYNLVLKFYDEDGNSTLDTNNVRWCWIKNQNMMFEFMTDEDPTIYIWKDNEITNEHMKSIIQRIRELSILNGISVQIKLYSNLDQRKIYNLIQQNMELEKEQNMNESIALTFSKLLNTANNTKKSSDFYLSESIKAKHTMSIINEMKEELNHFKPFTSKEYKEVFESLLSPCSLKEMNEKVNSLSESVRENFLNNLKSIENIGSYVKNAYLQDKFDTNKQETSLVMENTKVYSIHSKSTNENLEKAYNHLITVIEGAKSGTDILRMIRKHKLCETYNVSKQDLLDMWLSGNNKEIEEKKSFVIESLSGEKVILDESLVLSLTTIAKHLNNGGKADDMAILVLENENVKFNELTNLIENIEYKPSLKKYIKTINKLITETYNTINSSIDEIKESKTIDYSRQLKKLEEELSSDHPALKYVAESIAFDEQSKRQNHLFEMRKDDYSLRNLFAPYVSLKKARDVSESIINNKLLSTKPIMESINTKDDGVKAAREMYNNVYTANEQARDLINTVLFTIANNPGQLAESKLKGLKTLRKYVK